MICINTINSTYSPTSTCDHAFFQNISFYINIFYFEMCFVVKSRGEIKIELNVFRLWLLTRKGIIGQYKTQGKSFSGIYLNSYTWSGNNRLSCPFMLKIYSTMMQLLRILFILLMIRNLFSTSDSMCFIHIRAF